MLGSAEITMGLNYYQPPREAKHARLRGISSDPLGVNWTEEIYKQCYDPMAKTHVLRNTAFNMLGTLRHDLSMRHHETAQIYKSALRTNGVADTFVHAILPFLPIEDKHILIEAGKQALITDTGMFPRVIWAAESALDEETLLVLAQHNYQGVVCAPEQAWRADGGPTASQPIRVKLKENREIIALPFEGPLSREFGFAEKHNADQFFWDHIAPAFNSKNRVITYVDAEIGGHHWPFGDKFLEYMVTSTLPRNNIRPVPFNMEELRKEAVDGGIHPNTAWSCPHGNLTRWRGECGCLNGQDGRWKAGVRTAFAELNDEVTNVVKENVNGNYYGMLTRNFRKLLDNPGGKGTKSEVSFLSSKTAALAAQLSCVTFFSTIGTAGKPAVLMAIQSTEHLRDAGMEKQAAEITAKFYEGLRNNVKRQDLDFLFEGTDLRYAGIT